MLIEVVEDFQILSKFCVAIQEFHLWRKSFDLEEIGGFIDIMNQHIIQFPMSWIGRVEFLLEIAHSWSYLVCGIIAIAVHW